MAQESSDKLFEEMVIPQMDALYRFACRLERDPDRAQDLLQDALLKGFRSFGRLQEVGSFRPWMSRILYRTFLDRRRAQVTEVPLDDRTVGDAGTNVPSFELAALFRERGASREVRDALDRLPLDQAVAVYLVDVEAYRYGEAAEVLKTSPGTVASRVSRGRNALKKSLHHLARERGWIDS